MARDAQSLKIQPWAAGGERVIPELEEDAIDRREGWDQQFGLPGGPLVSRPLMNQLMREIAGALYELNTGGVGEWSPWISYQHVAFVRWGGALYRSRRDSGPAYGGSFIPDGGGQTAWVRH